MLDFWQAASSCIVPMTLISFCGVRPPTKVGVAMTFMCTTVSTPELSMTRPIIGLRMSARTNSTSPMSLAGRDDVDPDHARRRTGRR